MPQLLCTIFVGYVPHHPKKNFTAIRQVCPILFSFQTFSFLFCNFCNMFSERLWLLLAVVNSAFYEVELGTLLSLQFFTAKTAASEQKTSKYRLIFAITSNFPVCVCIWKEKKLPISTCRQGLFHFHNFCSFASCSSMSCDAMNPQWYGGFDVLYTGRCFPFSSR